MARRLKTLARIIEDELGYTTRITRAHVNTDRKIGRLRSPGKGRVGNFLEVFDADGNLIFSHNAAETYRHNDEVENWLGKAIKERDEGKAKPGLQKLFG